ncbi:hypothetical protein KIPB_007796 [Kipferlia bialata]|uniref:Uncharacterized protein n=1 Tax=Kipferlia bialata TaxID=797122 RepID=A0A9K3GKA9_9EUKA|nr:hypothetical protein KIPB_007796 [Kipferlia bialata]|eukprot:g7796.t1
MRIPSNPSPTPVSSPRGRPSTAPVGNRVFPARPSSTTRSTDRLRSLNRGMHSQYIPMPRSGLGVLRHTVYGEQAEADRSSIGSRGRVASASHANRTGSRVSSSKGRARGRSTLPRLPRVSSAHASLSCSVSVSACDQVAAQRDQVMGRGAYASWHEIPVPTNTARKGGPAGPWEEITSDRRGQTENRQGVKGPPNSSRASSTKGRRREEGGATGYAQSSDQRGQRTHAHTHTQHMAREDVDSSLVYVTDREIIEESSLSDSDVVLTPKCVSSSHQTFLTESAIPPPPSPLPDLVDDTLSSGRQSRQVTSAHRRRPLSRNRTPVTIVGGEGGDFGGDYDHGYSDSAPLSRRSGATAQPCIQTRLRLQAGFKAARASMLRSSHDRQGAAGGGSIGGVAGSGQGCMVMVEEQDQTMQRNCYYLSHQ